MRFLACVTRVGMVFSRAVLRQASQYSQPPEAPQRTASTLRRLLEGVQQPMLESGAPPAADATPADADPLARGVLCGGGPRFGIGGFSKAAATTTHTRRRPPPRGL